MRTLICLVTLIPASLSWACGGVTEMPAGPSPISLTPVIFAAPGVVTQALPTLTGRWRVSGTNVFRNLESGSTQNWGGCSGSFTINTQEGDRFSGSLATQGGGWNSDRFCTASGTLTGEVLAGGNAARAMLEGNSRNWPRPSVNPSCEFISMGDGIWTGSATGDSIRLQTGDTLRCPVSIDGGIAGMPTANFERTVSLTFERW